MTKGDGDFKRSQAGGPSILPDWLRRVYNGPMRRKNLLLFLVFLPVFLLACALSEMAANSAGQPAGSAQSQPDPLATAQPADLRLDAAASGLGAYAVQFQAGFSGTDQAGKPYASTLLLSEEYDSAQPARHLLAKTETSGQPPASLEVYHLGQAAYLVSTELSSQSGCVQLSADAAEQPVLRPGDIILSLAPGDLVAQGEDVGGVTADHYKLAGLRLGVGQVNAWEGDIWVAQSGGYVVRSTGWADGQVTLTGQPGTGRLQWTYTLTPTNPAGITLPADCGDLNIADVPLPPGAANVVQHGAQVVFSSPSPAQEVVDFYHQSLPQGGWTIDNESGTGDLFTLQASKEGRALEALVEAQEAGCKVSLTLR